MNPDSELDMILSHSQDDDPMESDAFAGAVMIGVKQRRMRRRVTLALAGGLITALAVAACVVMPVPLLAAENMDLRNVLALLVLAALIASAWLRTEGLFSVT